MGRRGGEEERGVEWRRGGVGRRGRRRGEGSGVEERWGGEKGKEERGGECRGVEEESGGRWSGGEGSGGEEAWGGGEISSISWFKSHKSSFYKKLNYINNF